MGIVKVKKVGSSELVLVTAQHQIFRAVSLDDWQERLNGVGNRRFGGALKTKTEPYVPTGGNKLPEDGSGSWACGHLYSDSLSGINAELVLRGGAGLSNELPG